MQIATPANSDSVQENISVQSNVASPAEPLVEQPSSSQPPDVPISSPIDEKPTLASTILPGDTRIPPEGAPKGLPKHQSKFALASIRAVKRLKDAGPFLAPVDIVKLNIPTYFEIVKDPMDLGTMESKLIAGKYDSVKDFVHDMDLIVMNCESFNGKNSDISGMARNIRASFEKHMRNMPPYELPPKNSLLMQQQQQQQQQHAAELVSTATRPKREIHPPRSKDLPTDDEGHKRKKRKTNDKDLTYCGTVILKELTNKKHESYSYPFLEPVDPVAMELPNYFKVVKHPMDLSTISNKYNDDEYNSAEEFEKDIRLMFSNCYKFNPEGTSVNLMGHRLEALFDKKWADRPSTRVSASPPPPTPTRRKPSTAPVKEEYTEEELKLLAANPAIKFLEQQLERMQKDLMKMKRESLQAHQSNGSRNKKNGSTTRRKPSTASAAKNKETTLTAKPILTYEQKKELSEVIETLSDNDMAEVLNIIRDYMPVDADGNIELDMNEIPDDVLVRLYNKFVRDRKAKSVISSKALPVASNPAAEARENSSDEDDDSDSSSDEE